MLEIVNEAAKAYDGNIPSDRYRQPYMPLQELVQEIDDGVSFYGAYPDGRLVAIMGIQDRGAVELIRHAYTLPSVQRRGFGSLLLTHLLRLAKKPIYGRDLEGSGLGHSILRETWLFPSIRAGKGSTAPRILVHPDPAG